MVAADLLGQLSKLQVTNYVGVEDFADKLNFLYSIAILMVCFTIITIKTYVMTPMHCFIPHQLPPTFINYVDNYCWVQGTYAVDIRSFRTRDVERGILADKKITYYQWVPFMLGLLAILFYIPRLFWATFSYNRTGTDLQHLINSASDAVHADKDKREKTINHIIRTLETMLFYHRDIRGNKFASFKRRFFKMTAFVLPSKRYGTWLVFTYFFTKLLYLANSVGQLHLLAVFLGFSRKNSSYFGLEVAQNLVSGRDWNDTMIFPRVGCCAVRAKLTGTSNLYMTQCVLPINMLNEKIFVFLWFWLVFCCIMNIISIFMWLYRMVNRSNRAGIVKTYLKVADKYKPEKREQILEFISQFLRHDGIFLIRMISLNAGDIVTCDIVTGLWNRYLESYAGRDMRNDYHRTMRESQEPLIDSKPSSDGDSTLMVPLSKTPKGRARRQPPSAPPQTDYMKPVNV